MTASGALAGIRVLEIGEMVSAPYATKLMAGLGADVIKVEDPAGDRARTRGPFPPSAPGDPNASGLFLALNTNKRSVVIDGDGGSLRDRLVGDADIIITNYGPDHLASMGFDLERARVQRPELVVCSITPFGLTGPYAGYRAEEITVAHGGGWAYLCPGASSDVDEPPLKVFGHQTDFHSGVAGAMAALAAYRRAELTGIGDHIDLSTMAHTAAMLETAVLSTSYTGGSSSRLGSRLLNPWGIFPCAPTSPTEGETGEEELVFLATIEQDQWERLVPFMGNPEWVATGLFDTMEQRLENDDLLKIYLEEWTRQHTVSELWHGGKIHRVCFAPVLTMPDMENEDHLHERGFFVDVDHPAAGTVTHLGSSFLSIPAMDGPTKAAPLLDPDGASITFGPPRSTGHRPEPPNGAIGPDRPLAGIRVLDLSWVWAGPYCTLHLAHLGADVIKIESEQRPGIGRRLPFHPPGIEPSLNTSGYFNQWGQGKRSCRLDLSRPEAIDVVKRLVAQSDVVVENFATGVMEKLGLGYAELQAVKPDIIVASISGYGSSGPLRHHMGYGPTTGPLSGLTSLTGYRDGPPRELGISVGDPAAGITTAFAICAAILNRRAGGGGCYIDTALWEATASFAVEGWMPHAMGGSPPERAGNRDSSMAPHGCYRTGDLYGPDHDGDDDDPGQWISIACATDEEWQAMAALMQPPLHDDRRFTTETARKANEDALDAAIADWVYGRDRWQLTERLQGAGVAAFPSLTTEELLADPHLAARGFFSRLEHPEVGVQAHAGIPWRSATSDDGVTSPAPTLGQHTEEILNSLLGLTAAEIQRMEDDGVIA